MEFITISALVLDGWALNIWYNGGWALFHPAGTIAVRYHRRHHEYDRRCSGHNHSTFRPATDTNGSSHNTLFALYIRFTQTSTFPVPFVSIDHHRPAMECSDRLAVNVVVFHSRLCCRRYYRRCCHG